MCRRDHSAIDVQPYNMNKAEESYSFVTVPDDIIYNLKKLKHIHEQLGHPSQSTMEIMMKNAGF